MFGLVFVCRFAFLLTVCYSLFWVLGTHLFLSGVNHPRLFCFMWNRWGFHYARICWRGCAWRERIFIGELVHYRSLACLLRGRAGCVMVCVWRSVLGSAYYVLLVGGCALLAVEIYLLRRLTMTCGCSPGCGVCGFWCPPY